jgi:hypothetical protein
MRTVPEIVAGLVRASPFLEDALAAGIVNHSGLARTLRAEVEREAQKRVQLGAIIVALGRLSRSISARGRKPRSVFSRVPDLIVRLNLFEVTYANSRALVQKQKMLFERAGPHPQSFLTITRGINETTIIASRELRERVLRACRGESLVSEIGRLASVTVMLPPGTARIPGVYSYILKALAWEGLNVVEVVSTLNEFTVILDDGSIDAAFAIIKRLF